MKIAFLLKGISGGEGNRTDWKKCKDNIQNAINYLSINNTVNVYVVSYIHPSNYEMAMFYNPKKILLLPLKGSSQRKTGIESMKFLLTEDIDFIITIRFDFEFNLDISKWNFQFDKFNILHKEFDYWHTDQFVSDLVFAFPKMYIQEFITAMEIEDNAPYRPDCDDFHPIYRHLVNKVDAHFLFENCTSQGDFITYSFTRYEGNTKLYTVYRRNNNIQ